ncbi:hypothetical protein [Georgenia sp. SYP-B2076]|uniref:hypothetical protein n=1 Tax=Georgenia sp. SYP-B2076 TaxID=2495881 RepID=UPI000F8E9A7A|nr:hypothetical protein [Georgenia sp. SYP-B2076]
MALQILPRPLPQVTFSRDVGADAIRPEHRSGELVRVRSGAYIHDVPDAAPWQRREREALGRCVAVARQLTCEFVFSHISAALIHGCWIWQLDDKTHITQPLNPSTGSSADVRRHVAEVPPGDVVVVNGLRVTALVRTIEDCALTMHPRDALVIADSALRILAAPSRRERANAAGRVERVRRELVERLARKPGARGIVRARAVVKYADAFSESAWETVLRWIAVSRGLPAPVTQYRVVTHRGTYFSDLAWTFRTVDPGGRTLREWTLHVEFDGRIKYANGGADASRAMVDEKLREDAIRALGDDVRRFDQGDVRDEEGTFRRLRAAFPAAMVTALRPVAGLMVPGGPEARRRPRHASPGTPGHQTPR